MKPFLLFFLLTFGVSNAQYLIEDNDITENNVMSVGESQTNFDLSNPIEFYRLKCSNPNYAKLPGGDNAFKGEIRNKLRNFFDSRNYFVNGTFEFIF